MKGWDVFSKIVAGEAVSPVGASSIGPSPKAERGQELVEFALLLPLLLMLLLGIAEFGLAVLAYNSISNISREVARYGVVHPDVDEIEDYIDEDLDRWTTGVQTPSLKITPTLSLNGPLSNTVHVTVTYRHHFLTGPMIQALGGNPELDMQAVSTMYTEFVYTN
jgi:hypothetical protein